MTDRDIQGIINKAVNIATRAALAGRPVEKVIWIPPQTASSDPRGNFCPVKHATTTGDIPSWEQ